jgi:hypothetical protein
MQTNRDAFIIELAQAGYHRMGNPSCFAEVFGHVSDHSHVVKVGVAGRVAEDGWLAYAKWTRESGVSSPHFPRVDTLEIVETASGHPMWFAAKIERLEEVAAQPAEVRSSLTHATQESSAKLYEPMRQVELPAPLADAIVRINEQFKGKFNFDLHAQNVMVRPTAEGPVLVLTDPLSHVRGC